MTAAALPRKTLRRNEVAKTLGLSIPTIDRLIGRGELDSLKRGRSRLIPVAAVDAYIARKLKEAKA